MYKVVFATSTFYTSMDDLRFKLACRFVKDAKTAGYQVVIIDGSPNKGVFDAFRALGAAVREQTDPGLDGSKRQAYKMAGAHFSFFPIHGKQIILANEPEKYDVVNHVQDIVAPIVNGEADIVVMGRTEASLKTYPPFQAVSESTADYVYQKATGIPAAPMVGPVAFELSVSRYFTECRPEDYGIRHGYIQHIAPVVAYADGHRVKRVNVDFIYPEEQAKEEMSSKLDEMMTKRLVQLQTCIESYYLLAERFGLPRKV